MQVIHNKDSSFANSRVVFYAVSLIQRIFLSRENSYELNAIDLNGQYSFYLFQKYFVPNNKMNKNDTKVFPNDGILRFIIYDTRKKERILYSGINKKKKLFELFDVIFSVKA